MITILGPTACGKTRLAVLLAAQLDAEIISADSRQVYRGMDIGTGKDVAEYTIEGKPIPCHLIDIVDAGYVYNVHEYVRDFHKAFNDISSGHKEVILCGGTGLYLEAVIKGYRLTSVPENQELRARLALKTNDELISLLISLKKPHNTSDFTDRKRLLRAIEIETYYCEHPDTALSFKPVSGSIFGIDMPRELIRSRITERLHHRLENGMIEEVQALLNNGVTAVQLKYYGLEYKYITQYLEGELTYSDMVRLLNTAIHQFAKRQMTWFRRMEKQGIDIRWIDGMKSDEEKINDILNQL